MEQDIKSLNKILIGIPTGSGHVDYRFASSLAALTLSTDTTLIWIPRVMIDTARNEIVKKALSDNFTHLLMLDDDMTFPSETLTQLLSHDKDVVGVQAFKRRDPYEPCVYKMKEGKNYPVLVKDFIEVDAIGTGIILIKVDVFKKISYPFFWTDYDKDGTHWGVDFRFCQKARDAGFQIFCDPDLDIGHIGDPPVTSKLNFLEFVKNNKIDGEKGSDLKTDQPSKVE
jgi:hypothetical protein